MNSNFSEDAAGLSARVAELERLVRRLEAEHISLIERSLNSPEIREITETLELQQQAADARFAELATAPDAILRELLPILREHLQAQRTTVSTLLRLVQKQNDTIRQMRETLDTEHMTINRIVEHVTTLTMIVRALDRRAA